MKNPDLQLPHANTPFLLLMVAAASLFAGTLTYLLARPVAPALMIEVLKGLPASALQDSLFLPFAHQLPSFFHMLAMLLATLAVTAHQPRLRVAALGVTAILGVAMEFVQHPAVLNSVDACTKTPFCSWLPGLENYARSGTFDPRDLAAIACALIITSLYSHKSSLFKISNRHYKDLT